MSIVKFKNTINQLLPTGRAYKMPRNGWLYSLVYALSISLNKAYMDVLSTLDTIIPDNNNFDEEDASDWERRLGLPTNSNVSLADRKLAIYRKMRHPGNIPARQHYLYIQGQLQDAGFDVYVYENRFPDGGGGFETRSPFTVFGTGSGTDSQHGAFNHGQRNHGTYWQNKVANLLDQDRDSFFNTGSNLRSTFFISGDPVTTPAYVDVNRKKEFRQLILKLKPVQTVAYLNVVYV